MEPHCVVVEEFAIFHINAEIAESGLCVQKFRICVGKCSRWEGGEAKQVLLILVIKSNV